MVPVPVGPRGGRPATWARTSACTSPSTPSGTSTAGARSPTPRRCSTATAGSPAPSTTCGTTPTSTRSAGSAGPRSSGRSCGASTSATSTPTWAPCSCGPSSSTSTSTWPSSSASRSASRAPPPSGPIGFPFRRLAAEEGVVFPDHFVARQRRVAAGGHRAGAVRPPPGRHRALRPPRGRHPRAAGPRRPTGRPGSTTSTWSATTPARGHARALRRHAHRLPGAARAQRAG